VSFGRRRGRFPKGKTWHWPRRRSFLLGGRGTRFLNRHEARSTAQKAGKQGRGRENKVFDNGVVFTNQLKPRYRKESGVSTCTTIKKERNLAKRHLNCQQHFRRPYRGAKSRPTGKDIKGGNAGKKTVEKDEKLTWAKESFLGGKQKQGNLRVSGKGQCRRWQVEMGEKIGA